MKFYNDAIMSACTCVAVDKTTFCQWAWYYSMLKWSLLGASSCALFCACLYACHVFVPHFLHILWSNRYKNNTGNTCLTTVDGADFRIHGQKLLDIKPNLHYFSYKFKSPGLHYLAALYIYSSDIVTECNSSIGSLPKSQNEHQGRPPEWQNQSRLSMCIPFSHMFMCVSQLNIMPNKKSQSTLVSPSRICDFHFTQNWKPLRLELPAFAR